MAPYMSHIWNIYGAIFGPLNISSIFDPNICTIGCVGGEKSWLCIKMEDLKVGQYCKRKQKANLAGIFLILKTSIIPGLELK